MRGPTTAILVATRFPMAGSGSGEGERGGKWGNGPSACVATRVTPWGATWGPSGVTVSLKRVA
ncbi:hypothetical protein E2562_035633 [Oryza meyeriana var. granulata]|uniref:Uncharacterized protein n=1 Tax=Oryza meyeriana var. granulata TaxID=110450 RepID=A0A6G1E7W0_9ORYZ|nr:hypothetical protein E2562_035633 [Oryza meyeriana var. granulata]